MSIEITRPESYTVEVIGGSGGGTPGPPGPQGEPGEGVAPGGTTGQVLSKIDATDYNTEWTTPATGDGSGGNVPAGGTAGQTLAKVDATDYNTHWVTPSAGGGDGSLPPGTAPGDLLFWLPASTTYEPGPIVESYDEADLPPSADTPNRIVFIRDRNGGQSEWTPGDGSARQPLGLALGGPWKVHGLANDAAGGSNAPLTGQPAGKLNLRAGANVTITGGYDSQGDKLDYEISATGGGSDGGGGPAILAAAQEVIATAINAPPNSQWTAIGTLSVTFTAPASGRVVVTVSGYLTPPTAGSLQVAMLAAGVPVTYDGVNSSIKACGALAGNFAFTRTILFAGLIANQSYTWSPGLQHNQATPSGAVGQDAFGVMVQAA